MARTVAEKMGVRAGARAHVVGAPPEAVAAMGLPELDLAQELEGDFDHLHVFVTRQEDLVTALGSLRDHLRPRGTLWVSWPKGGQLGTDLTLHVVIALAYDAGLVESTCLRVDDTWSALKLTLPKPGKIYHNSYGTLPGG
ncbi:hypothetical protein AA0Y32_08815 [Georgenia phoenicis]|uniref:hypothetical protein n=1 Tax=unclassified Georgenia TaxID=2626815 RepID=UPI0039AFFA3A